MQKSQLTITGEYITLGQFLKLAEIISSGGMARAYLAEYSVFVNGEEENRRGRKIYPKDQVEVPGVGLYFIRAEEETCD
ncbi:S4 domain-containing protein YaaA [Atopobacter sp. AH10]|uniref:S4 domain-containing protein YaaA n=1 Tax=Atopobacter sp. AH10 TaxID=2315861 RepID=UPI000EF233F1|nr:S4 domain-containing protein YaaA [Atopobacter sp. AH10]RLK62829.1 S4 domain-containing protein YaaA [Atopobacter sp. AH10]